jgi:hypothetical protein
MKENKGIKRDRKSISHMNLHTILENLNTNTVENYDDIKNHLLLVHECLFLPSDLQALYSVLLNFRLLIVFGQENPVYMFEQELWSPVVESIDYILQHRNQIQLLFPESIRASIHGLVKTNPIYTIFENMPSLEPNASAFKSILWTAYPYMIKLEENYHSDNEKYGFQRARLCAEIRDLKNPGVKAREVLNKLPSKPMEVDAMIKSINDALKDNNMSTKYEGESIVFVAIRDLMKSSHITRRPKLKSNEQEVSTQPHVRMAEPVAKTKSTRPWTGFSTQNNTIHVHHDAINENANQIYSKYYLTEEDSNEDEEKNKDPAMVFDGPSVLNIELDEEKINVFFLENRRARAKLNAKYAAQALEKSNQNLPIKNTTLSGYEWSIFLNCLINTSHTAWGVIDESLRAHVAAWAGCRAFLARPAAYIENLVAEGNSKEAQSTKETFKWKKNENSMVLSCQAPSHQNPTNSGNSIVTTSQFEIEIPLLLHDLLCRVEKDNGLIFSRSFEKEYSRLLKSINEIFNTELNPNRLENSIIDRMAQLTSGDYVTSVYFRGENPNNLTPAIYTALKVSRIHEGFRSVCKEIGRYAEYDLGFASDGMQIKLAENDQPFVGSKHVPQTSHVKQTIHLVRENLITTSKTIGVSPIYLHNLYTTYILMFFLSLCGVRPNSKLLPFDFDIDFKSGLCFVSEKDLDGYEYSRRVWLPRELLQQFKLYADHCFNLRRFVGVFTNKVAQRFDASREHELLSPYSMPNRTMDIDVSLSSKPFVFFLSEDGESILPVSPKQIMKYLPEEWEERIYSLRHFVRSYLYESRCRGEIIDPLYGHSEYGQDPWTFHSTLNPILWHQELSVYLSPLLKELNLYAIRSPLLGSLN